MSQHNPLPPSQFDTSITDGPDPPSPYPFNTRVMLGAILVLVLVVFIILILHLYARWFLRRSYAIRTGVSFSSLAASAPAQTPAGLDKDAIALLPTFVYTATSLVDNGEAGKSDASGALLPVPECAVCLSEFQDNEKGRMLPACKHIFHTECIDMWFFSHSTCPLCRTKVMPTLATSTETAPTDHVQQQAMEPSPGTTENNPAVAQTVEYPCNVLFWGNQTQVDSSQEPSTSSSLPVSPSLHMPGARALPQIAIDIPEIQSNVFVSTSECLSAKCTTEQEEGSSHPLKSPGLRASIKRMLSRQSSRHKSFSQDSHQESPK